MSAVPGLIVAAPRSGAGKTTVTLGLLRALRRSGLVVQPFKCGPDYIDPAHHTVAAGRTSFNLDTWAMRADAIHQLVAEQSIGADLAIVEGVMGLFDGAAGEGSSGNGSTADLGACLDWPVVLVLDVAGQAATAAAIALGCAHYRDDVRLAGVILNRVASDRHEALIRPAFQKIGVPVLGSVARSEALALPERHLGLVQASEISALDDTLDQLADTITAAVDLSALQRAALRSQSRPPSEPGRSVAGVPPPGQRIALAQDRAFSFVYPHIVHHWRQAGAEIVPFSPLANEVPDASADAVWLPGGYPELHAHTLAAADKFFTALAASAQRGVSIHGECGGFMVLGDGLVDADGRHHRMSGLLRLETSFAQRRLHLGYRRANLLADCALGRKGQMVAGHEFHYTSATKLDDQPLVTCTDAAGEAVTEHGLRRGSVSGTFFHAIDRIAT